MRGSSIDWISTVVLVEVLILALYVAFVFLLRDRLEFWRRPGVRIGMLVLASAILLLISSTRPIVMNEERLHYDRTAAAAAGPSELVTIELKKVNDEIQMRISQEDTWFHYKFLLIGALLAAFGGVFKFGADRQDVRFVEIKPTAPVCSSLALACIVAVAIDMHLRNNILVIQQLALWIANYAEPALATAQHGFVPWEQFLRESGGMHSDPL